MNKLINKKKKFINSIKSQFHQPPQFISWKAHQLPKIKAKQKHIKIIAICFLKKNMVKR